METLVVGGSELFMAHDMMRLIKKAKVTAGFRNLASEGLYKKAHSLEDKIRVISNGKEAAVMLER